MCAHGVALWVRRLRREWSEAEREKIFWAGVVVGGDSAARCGFEKTFANTNTSEHLRAFVAAAWCRSVRYPVGVVRRLDGQRFMRGGDTMIDNLRQGRVFFMGMTRSGGFLQNAII